MLKLVVKKAKKKARRKAKSASVRAAIGRGILPGKSLGPIMKRSRSLAGPRPRVRDRQMSLPVARQRSIVTGSPQFNSGRGFVVRHREWLQQISSNTTFTGAGRYIIQPGLTDNFPWLGQIAANFENYKFRNVRYIYRNRTASSTSYTIYCGVQYDVSDPEFKSIEELMTYTNSREEVAWKDFSFDVKPSKGQLTKKYMVRTDTLPSGLDPTAYDTALFTICGVGAALGTYLGDLLVEYDIEFTNPKMNPNLVAAAGCYSFSSRPNESSLAAAPWGGITFSNPTASLGDSKGFSPDNVPRVVNSATATPAIDFPVPGAYKVEYTVDDPGGTAVLTGSNFTTPVGSGSVLSSFQNYAGIAGKGLRQFCDVITTTPFARLTMGSLTATGSSASSFATTLLVTCESLNYMLERFGNSPNPPMDPEFLSGLKAAFPKHDLSTWERRVAELKNEERLLQILRDVKSDVKRRLPAIILSRQPEVQPEEAENSDGDMVEVPLSRLRSVDKRSKSSERKEGKT
jgi:hypothetical protein